MALVQVASNVPRFYPGKFGQAVMVEEGTTNIFPHSKSFEECSGTHIGDPSNSNGVTTDVGGGWKLATHYNSATIKISEDGGLFGSKRLSFIHDGSSGWKGAVSSDWSIVAGKTYTVTVWARANQASTKSFSRGYAFYEYRGQQYSFSWPDGYPTDAKNAGKWVRGICTFTATADESGQVFLYGLTDGEAGLIIDYDGLQVEEKSYATSFTDGTRSPETLTIPTAGVLSPQEGTVECWVYVPEFLRVGIPHWRRIWGIGRTAGAGMYVLRYDPSLGKVVFGIYDNAGTAQNISVDKPSIGWHYFATRWSTSEMALFIDGVKVGYISNPSLPTNFADTVLSIGCRPDGPYDNINSLIDDLRISSRARTDEEIAAAYASGKPLPCDEWTTYKLGFDGTLRPTIRKFGMMLKDGEITCQHADGSYTQLSSEGLKRFVSVPIYKEVPTGTPNTEGFESGAFPNDGDWERSNTTDVIVTNTDKRSGSYCLQIASTRVPSFARATKFITKDAQISFYYKTLISGAKFIIDGTTYSLGNTNGSWVQFAQNVTKGYHYFQWLGAYDDDEQPAYGMRVDDIVFEQNPVQYVVDGYANEGYEYNFRTFVGSAATFGKFVSKAGWGGVYYSGTENNIPDVWIQLPPDFAGKDFKVNLSFKSIDTTSDNRASLYKLTLEVLETDSENARFKVRARASSYGMYYGLKDWGYGPFLTYDVEYVDAGFNFTYIATY